jgi:drug/metabolite transporter (DMT)-like permease
VLAASQVSASAAITLVPALIWGVSSAPPTAGAIIGIALLGLLGTGMAYVWNYRNIELAGSVIASSVTYITPVVAVILGVALLGDRLSLIQFLGGVLILLSAMLVQGRLVLIPTRDGREW